jgi:hypothetical protein
MTGYRSSESGMIDFQSALKAAQNLIDRPDYYSFHSRLTSISRIKKLAEHGGAPPVTLLLLFLIRRRI